MEDDSPLRSIPGGHPVADPHLGQSNEPCTGIEEGGQVSGLVDTRDIIRFEMCNDLAAMLYRVEADHLATRARHERRINEARQLGMYLANICLGLSFNQIALISSRDRATIRYSLERVEDRRENPQFDMILIAYETLLACLHGDDVRGILEKGANIDHYLVAHVPDAE